MTAADLLRRKAYEYELNAQSCRERQDAPAEVAWSTVAIALREVAEALDEGLEEAA